MIREINKVLEYIEENIDKEIDIREIGQIALMSEYNFQKIFTVLTDIPFGEYIGVNVIISGGMGGGAIEIFNEKNIEVVVGASGNARSAVEAWIKGELKSTGSVCHEHMHHDECE